MRSRRRKATLFFLICTAVLLVSQWAGASRCRGGVWEWFTGDRDVLLWQRLTEPVVKQVDQQLKQFDKDGDRRLSPEEFSAATASMPAGQVAVPLAERDYNGDNTLDRTELLFALLDTDASRGISREELLALSSEPQREEAGRLFRRLLGTGEEELSFGRVVTQQKLVAQQGRRMLVWTVLGAVLIVALLLFVLVVVVVLARYFRLWIQSKTTGAGIGIFNLLGMMFRNVDPAVIVRSKIMAVQAGLDPKAITTKALEAHYLAGGDVPLVIRALIAADKAKIVSLDFRHATAIDLAGRNVLEAVQTSVNPKVIDCPAPGTGRETLDGVAKNGIQLKVKARVTVRTNLEQLIGGATEETIIARVGEGIVSAIGSAETHLEVLENPDRISQTVLARRLDANTAYEIVSIDIADIDVGDNIGARLQADQAEADMRVAQANAESRRAMAVASEQEYIAKIEENRAKLVAAEAEVYQAMAEAFRSGRLGILDYYRLRNIQSDTDMRLAIARAGMPSSRTGIQR